MNEELRGITETEEMTMKEIDTMQGDMVPQAEDTNKEQLLQPQSEDRNEEWIPQPEDTNEEQLLQPQSEDRNEGWTPQPEDMNEEAVWQSQPECTEAERISKPVRTEVWRPDENSPYSPFYAPDKDKNNNNRITLCLIVLLLLGLVAGMIAAVSVLVETAMKEASVNVASWEEFVEKFGEEEKGPDEAFGAWEDDVPAPDFDFDYDFPEGFFGDQYGFYDPDDEYDEYEYEEEEDYVPNEADEYYVTITDSIRDDLSYYVEKQSYEYTENSQGVNVFVEYVVIESDELVFKDKINEHLEKGAMYYAREFGVENVSNLTLAVSSYVTYMDEDILSVVVDERFSWEGETVFDLYCMNFDLNTGELLYNTEMIEPTEELAEEFLGMSEYQNGYTAYLDGITAKEVCSYFEDEEMLILFYTPVGLEIGFNYPDGWITATIKEYEKYLRKL